MKSSLRYSLAICLSIVMTMAVAFAPNATKAADTPTLSKMSDEIAGLAQESQDAVVRIISTKVAKEQNDPLDQLRELFGPNFPERMAPRMQQQAPVVQGLGSGFIIKSDGIILTNNHVVAGSDEIEVQLGDERTFTGRVLGTDPQSEVAVVKIDAKNLPTLPVGDSSKLKVGNFVLAIGSPQGLMQSYSFGIVSALNRSEYGITDFADFIQTDAAINRGNSGGPLLNVQGEVVGICTAIISTSGGSQGLGFAIPINQAMDIANELIEHGQVRRGYLGVMLEDLSPEMAEHFGLSEDVAGGLVSEVQEGAPAEGKLKAEDVITAVNGDKVKDWLDLRNRVASMDPGDTVTLTIYRDGKRMDVKVKLGERPSNDELAQSMGAPGGGQSGQAATDDVDLGFSVQPLTPQMREQLGVAEDQTGVVVTKVEPTSHAFSKGLRAGMIIEQVNRMDVNNVKDLRTAIDKGKDKRTVLLRVVTPQGKAHLIIPKD